MKKILVSLIIILVATAGQANATMTKEAHQLYQEACQLEYRNNYESAIEKIRAAIDMSGEDAILYTKLAGLYADIGDYDNALGAYKIAIRLRPNDAFIYISIGNILQTTGDLNNAYNSYMQAMDIFPAYKYNYVNLANVLLAQGKYDKAIEYYNLFLAVYPEQVDARENLATAYLKSNKYALANSSYAIAYKASPTTFKSYANYGYGLFQEKQYANAVDMLKLELLDNPDNIKARANLAVSYHQLEKYDLSKQQFEQIFKLKPDFNGLRIYYAELLCDMKDYDASVEQYTQYIKSYPNVADAYKQLALVYKYQGKDELAIKNLLTALAKDNKDIEVKKELAYQYHKKNDYLTAIKYYDEVLKAEPSNYDVKANKALALHAIKHYDEAIKLYEDLLAQKTNDRLAQNYVSALISKGDYFLTKDRYNDAIKLFEKAVSYDSNQSYPYYGMAQAYECLKNNDSAQMSYEKALEIDPENEMYKKDYEAFKLATATKDEPVVANPETYGDNANTATNEKVVIKPVTEKDFTSGETPQETKQNVTPAQPQQKQQTQETKVVNSDEKGSLEDLDNLMIKHPTEQIEDNVKKLINEGDSLYKAGQNTQALEKYIEALKLTPNDSLTAFKTANLYKLENNPDKAIYYYKKATSINKSYADAWFNMGLVYASQGDYKSSKDCFNRVISLSPDYAYAYYALAMAYENESNIDKAIEYYQKYFDCENDDLTKKSIMKKINELQTQATVSGK